MNAGPHPSPLPQERENSAPRPVNSLALDFTSCPQTNTPKTATTTATTNPSAKTASPSLSPGERAGVRASVNTKLHFSLATPADDDAIRRLLRDNPMPGTISLSLEREPNYFADAHQPGENKQTIVARKADRIVCVGNCTTRLRFVNGQPRRVGYLGGLRLDASAAGRFDILRRGYEFFHELQASEPADFYFTSISADNHRARNFLERSLRGLPRYEFLGEFVTLLIGAPNTAAASSKSPRPQAEPTRVAPQFASLLNNFNQHYQFAPHWTAEQISALGQLGLRDEDWIEDIALWDQRCFKQTVIRHYNPRLATLRPAINLFARITGQPGLPAAGKTLSQAFALHTPAPGHNLDQLRVIAAQRGIEWLTLGFAANDSRLETIRQRFRCREYRSRLYLVRWPNLGGTAAELDQRILAPEVALL
jgi:hypothetical protein